MMDQLITMQERTNPDGTGDAPGDAIRKDLGSFFFGPKLDDPIEEEEESWLDTPSPVESQDVRTEVELYTDMSEVEPSGTIH